MWRTYSCVQQAQRAHCALQSWPQFAITRGATAAGGCSSPFVRRWLARTAASRAPFPRGPNQPAGVAARLERFVAWVDSRARRLAGPSGASSKFVAAGDAGTCDQPRGQWRSQTKSNIRGQVQVRQQVQQKDRLQSSASVVAAAIGSNVCLFTAKSCAAFYTGSSSLFAEAVHSFVDAMNEGLLLYGIRRSMQTPDESHPYGFQAERYAWALVSGVGVFFLGCGLSIYNGVLGLMNPPTIQEPFWAYLVLGCSLFFEGGTMLLALRQIRAGARKAGVRFSAYLRRGADPTSVQIFLEDCAGTLGVGLAASCLALSQHLELPWLDPLGSIGIGCVLGVVAAFLIRRNISTLVANSMSPERLKLVVGLLESDGTVRSVHDIKSTTLGPESVRFKAELHLDGAAVARRYVFQQRLHLDPQFAGIVAQPFASEDQAREWFVQQAGGLVDHLGDEMDRLALRVQTNVPEVKYCDLVVL